MINENDGYKKVCKLIELKDRAGRRFIVDDVEVALFSVDGNIYAVSNICPHQHTALIYDGFIEKGKVSCPAHGWEFDLKTGKMSHGGKGLDTYDVKIIDGDVYVKVTQKEWSW
ncbi:MAG: Rieske (2Fe-2S) protein [Melioribacteraceae bacterium]|nr:Rieske (2Fe-2S) protein [Melioribacteraceae bacterium]MCF8357048.1 Rieske (2Fe-2S) protein [Melioribacteraceae bacterium]MCF8396505.1 Rieske (2Fe-2S) protein [Melioribacteraceae bacterium]